MRASGVYPQKVFDYISVILIVTGIAVPTTQPPTSKTCERVSCECAGALCRWRLGGDARYGAPVSGEAEQRSRDGKMEKAYLSFRANHPSWRDDTLQGAELLSKIGGNGSVEAVHLTAAAAAAAACAAGSASCAACLHAACNHT